MPYQRLFLSDRPAQHDFDVLADVLGRLRVRTTLYTLARLRGDWGVAFPVATSAYFHVVGGAGAWLTLPGDEPHERWLASGDVVLLARGSEHRLTSAPGGRVRVLFDPSAWRANRIVGADAGSAAAPAALVCGAVAVQGAAGGSLFGALPTVVHIAAASRHSEGLAAVLTLIDREGEATGPGSEVLLARLGDVLLIQILRAWLAEHDRGDHGGWLGALSDPEVGAAIAAVHADPGAPWTVAALAARAALSRSRFAERFTALVGESPLAYVARWRMIVAAELLRDSDRTVADIGLTVGYRSEPAFSRAFSRFHEVSPRRYARAGAQSTSAARA